MGSTPAPQNRTPHEDTDSDARSHAVTICAETAWERIATARDIVAEHAGCSPDEALRALKEHADVLGDPIGTLAEGVIGGNAVDASPSG